MKTSNIVVESDSSGLRLDVFLSEHLQITRSQIQKYIANQLILVNNELPQKTGQKLYAGDSIVIKNSEHKEVAPAAVSGAKKTSKKTSEEPDLYKQIKIIAETPDYVVIEKPSGLLTHPTEANEAISLAGFMVAHYPEIATVGESEVRPGIVHRLDKEASGLLVVARTQAMFEHLKNQFKDRTIDKEYCVLVHGKVAKDADQLHFRLSRSKTSERMAASPITKHGAASSEGKEALTEFWVEKRFVNFTLLEVKIHTGRMHQIRAHFLAYNHPVVGDPLYFQKKRKRRWDNELGRLFLHSAKLGFTDLNGEQQKFSSVLPITLKNFLEKLS